MTDLHAQVKPLLPGLAISAVVAVAAMFLAEHYGAPVMLFALLLGMALNFLTQEEGGQKNRSAAGIDFTAKAVLRLGVRCWACASPPIRSWRWAGSPLPWWCWPSP